MTFLSQIAAPFGLAMTRVESARNGIFVDVSKMGKAVDNQ
jgi:hypothetical protein